MTAAEVAEFNQLLTTNADQLNRGSRNYHFSAKLWHCSGMAGTSAKSIIQKALGEHIVLGRINVASADEVITSFKNGMEYEGDEGSCPNLKFLRSLKSQESQRRLLAAWTHLARHADSVFEFDLKDGHPFYPVFWDFAYLIEKGSDAYLFIASSSD